MGAMTTCESCGAEIIWVTTQLGKKMPMDRKPMSRGQFRLEQRSNGELVAIAVPSLYQSHFATCPNAKEHRKR